jgi:hypothetical protein
MKVFITGGTGFVGSAVSGRLIQGGHEVVVLSRSGRSPGPSGARVVRGDPVQAGDWQDEAARADAAVNLAGESIFQRWNKEVKKRLTDSRVLTTRHLVDALAAGGRAPALLSASAVGYYGPRGDETIDESSAAGNDFLADLCVQWEAEANRASDAGARTTVMRFGIVLDRGGGALEMMTKIFKWGLGGRLGSGDQYFSWIHRRDLADAVSFLLENPDAAGAFNLTAPHPVTNAEMTKTLAQKLSRPAILPAPGFAVRGALGEFGSVLLEGQRVYPQNLLDAGFEFTFPRLEQALDHALGS